MDITFAIIVIIGWIIVGVVAAKRERSVIGWMLLAMFISPFIVLLILLCLPNKRKVRLAEEAKEEQRRREHHELIAALAGRRDGIN